MSTKGVSLASNPDHDKASRAFFEKWLAHETADKPDESEPEECGFNHLFSDLPYDWYVQWCEKIGVPSSGVDLSKLVAGLEITPSVGDAWSPSYVISSIITSFSALANNLSNEQAESLVRALLSLETRLDAATTVESQQEVLQVIEPLRSAVLRRLRSFKKYRFLQGEHQFFLDFARELSRFPIRYRGMLHVFLHFKEEKLKVLLHVHPHTSHDSLVDSVLNEVTQCAPSPLGGGAPNRAISRERVQQVVTESLGAGPPYRQLWLLSEKPATGREKNVFSMDVNRWHANIVLVTEFNRVMKMSRWSKGIEPPDDNGSNGSTDGTTTTTDGTSPNSPTSDKPHQTTEDKKMSLECLRIRKEVQEDLLDALTQAAKNIDAENNAIMREIFNPL